MCAPLLALATYAYVYVHMYIKLEMLQVCHMVSFLPVVTIATSKTMREAVSLVLVVPATRHVLLMNVECLRPPGLGSLLLDHGSHR